MAGHGEPHDTESDEGYLHAALREDVDKGGDLFLRGSSPIDRAIISRITSELPA
jgi:hypothetical protein